MCMNFQRLLALLSLLPAVAMAQTWPAHPITIVMGFPAGSGVDVVARMLQEPMEKSLSGRVVPDYRTRRAGNPPSLAVAQPRPAGDTPVLRPPAAPGGDP